MISPEGLSVPALLDAAAEQDREAAVFPDGRARVTELSALSSSYARALVSLGVGPGDHVGALLPAGLSVVALILGAARIGAVAVPFSTRLRAGEIAYLVDHSDARVMLVSPEGAGLLTAAFPGLATQRGPAVRVPEAACLRSVAVAGGGTGGDGRGAAFQSWEELVAGADVADRGRRVAELAGDVRPEDELVVIYTSGTTANPRMATFKVPRYVRFVTELPMSGTKIQKTRLRQRIADELSAASVTEAPRLSRPAVQAESA